MKTFREYLAEGKVEKEVNESIKYTKTSAEKQWDELQLDKLIIRIPEDNEFDITIHLGKEEIDVTFDDLEDLCKKILKLI